VSAHEERALFVGPQGRRLSPRAIDLVVRSVAGRAGLQLSAHVLAHTCVTNLVRAGNDLVPVAELAGHRRLKTTRQYSLPSAPDRQAAMDALEIEDRGRWVWRKFLLLFLPRPGAAVASLRPGTATQGEGPLTWGAEFSLTQTRRFCSETRSTLQPQARTPKVANVRMACSAR